MSSTSSYVINKWEGLVTPNSTKMQPVIYIQPDTRLLNYARINGNKFSVRISNSESLYDNKPIIGNFTESKKCCEDIECGDNSYIFILDTEWIGVPLNLGNIDIYGVIEEDSTTTHKNAPLRALPVNSSNSTNKKYTWIIWVIIAILIAICIVLAILYVTYDDNSSIILQPTVNKVVSPTTPTATPIRVVSPTPDKKSIGKESINFELTFMKAGLSNEILKNRLSERRISITDYGIGKFRSK
jgi:hypothetical protein